MRKVLTFGFFIVFAFITFFGCGHPSHMETPNRNQPIMNTERPASGADNPNANLNVTSTDVINGQRPVRGDTSNFIEQAAAGSMAEVELGRMAAGKAQNAEVRQYAQRMVEDHSRMNNELKPLASQKNVNLPATLEAEHKMMMERLGGLSGAEFDRAYMQAMVADHEKTVQMFQREAESGTDPDLKALASKSLPILQSHLQAAREISSKLQ